MLVLFTGHSSGGNPGRDMNDNGPFGRHINLHLTYSFQQQSKTSPLFAPHQQGIYFMISITYKFSIIKDIDYLIPSTAIYLLCNNKSNIILLYYNNFVVMLLYYNFLCMN